MDGTGSALRDPAAEFRPGQSGGIAQCPEQGSVGFQIDVVLGSVDRQRDHFCSSSFGSRTLRVNTASGWSRETIFQIN
jgi:hypothetical protein